MKHFCIICALCVLVVVLAGCEKSEDPSRSYVEKISENQEAPETDAVPAWAQGVETEGQLFRNLNLDGVGDSDDEVYFSIYRFGDFEDKGIVLRVHLGTGETMARILPVFGHCSLQTGTLFSEERDAIVLEVEVPGSNYGAASLFVYDVFPAGPDPVPSIVDRANTAVSPVVSAANGLCLKDGEITSGTEITDVDGSPLQGLTVYSIGENGKWQEVRHTLLWTGGNVRADDGWTILED